MGLSFNSINFDGFSQWLFSIIQITPCRAVVERWVAHRSRHTEMSQLPTGSVQPGFTSISHNSPVSTLSDWSSLQDVSSKNYWNFLISVRNSMSLLMHRCILSETGNVIAGRFIKFRIKTFSDYIQCLCLVFLCLVRPWQAGSFMMKISRIAKSPISWSLFQM